jgi:hypothetical protein
MLQDSSRKRGIPAFVLSSLNVSSTSGNSASHNSLYTSLDNQSAEAPERRENRVFRLLFIVLAKAVSSALAFLCRFPGALANSVKRSVKAHFSERPEGKPHSCSPQCWLMCILRLYMDSDAQLLCPDGWFHALCGRETLPHTTAWPTY